jgi:asparagine synthase (glutamine-hydrolysing)
MCGIAGIYNLDQRPIAIPQLRAMADLLKHRGPDDEGFALFNTASGVTGHFKGPDSPDGVGLPDIRSTDIIYAPNLGLMERRLAILDLSPAGHTPMTLPHLRFRSTARFTTISNCVTNSSRLGTLFTHAATRKFC